MTCERLHCCPHGCVHMQRLSKCGLEYSPSLAVGEWTVNRRQLAARCVLLGLNQKIVLRADGVFAGRADRSPTHMLDGSVLCKVWIWQTFHFHLWTTAVSSGEGLWRTPAADLYCPSQITLTVTFSHLDHSSCNTSVQGQASSHNLCLKHVSFSFQVSPLA